MSSAAQVLRQAESLKASISDSGRSISEQWVTRQRLEDLYKRLLLMDLEYALDKKVEQDLWNHAFKNQITTLQTQAKEKHNAKKTEVQANLNLFLETASGFYLQFLQLICSTFKLDLPFRRKSAAFGVMKEKCQLRAKITPPKKSSCMYICQYCLVHLGDIARYRQQVEQAQTYYRHAVNLSPQNGQPYNQLAILEVNRNNKLSSVFYYVRSLAVRHPFPVAATNLEKFYAKLIKDTSEFKGKMAQNEFVNAFLQFQALLHLAADFNRSSYLCDRILACLPAHLVSQTFSASVLVQCVAITIFTLDHIRHAPPSGGDINVVNTTPRNSNGNIVVVEDPKFKMPTSSVELLLSKDEEKSIQVLLGFTASVLELLVQHTPRLPAKARESPTLPAIQVLLDWLRHTPDLITNPPFSTSSIWGHLAKMLNTLQQVDGDKSKVDLKKYEEVPLPEDTELRCFQPIEKAHSKYSFSRVLVDGFPRGVEELVRCSRLVAQGQSIAEDYPQLNLIVTQQTDPSCVVFSATAFVKGNDPPPVQDHHASPSPQDRRSKQNVAMQTIMKHGQGEQKDMVKEEDKDANNQSCSGQTSPKYVLGTITSEPQFMKHGNGGTSTNSINSGGNGSSNSNSSGRQGSSPNSFQASLPPRFAAQQARAASPLPKAGMSPENVVASPVQGLSPQIRVASSQSQQQQQPITVQQAPQQKQPQPQQIQLMQQKPGQQQKQSPPHAQSQPHQQPQQQQPMFQPRNAGSANAFGIRGSQPTSPGPLQSSAGSGPNPPLRFQGHHQGIGMFQGQGGPGGSLSSQSHLTQNHPSQVHAPQGHPSQNQPPPVHSQLPPSQTRPPHGPSFQGQGPGMPPPNQGHGIEGQSGFQARSGPANFSQFSSLQMPFTGANPERFLIPGTGLGSLPGGQGEGARMPPFPIGQAATGGSAGVPIGANAGQNVRQMSPNHPFNPEILSALRLASQISQQQQHALSSQLSPQQHQQRLHQQQQVQLSQQSMPHGPPVARVSLMSHGSSAGPNINTETGMSPFSNPPPQFHPGLVSGMGFGPGSKSDQHGPTPSLSNAQYQAQMMSQPRQDGSFSSRPTAPFMPLMNQQNMLSGFPALSNPHHLFRDEGSGPRNDSSRGFQPLSPLTIQPPKPTLADTRINTSFQGHAEGTPKPEKAEVLAPEKKESESVMRRVEMPVAQPSGEYSLFASSSPWSMSLNAGADSKSLTSSPFSSQDSSMRNSPVVGFDVPSGPSFDPPLRRATPLENWIGQSGGYDEAKARVPHSGNMTSLWSEPPTMTPLERLLEQQRHQRQTDPH